MRTRMKLNKSTINAMKRIALLFTLVLTPVLMNGQDIQIRSEKPKDISTDLDLSSYDGQSPYFDIVLLNKHPHYYDGHKILFLPNQTGNYDFIDGFRIAEAVPCYEANDTTWNKNHTKIKKIVTPLLDVYKPAKVQEGNVLSYEHLRLGSGCGEIRALSGYYTPKASIEGKVFTILSASSETREDGSFLKEHITYYTINLKSESGDVFIWTFSRGLVGWKYVFMPIVMNDYIEHYKSFVGKNFILDSKDYFSNNEPLYKCRELCFAPLKTIYDQSTKIGYYYSPALSFEYEGKELLYEIIPKKDFGWLPAYRDMTIWKFEKLVEQNQYYALKEAAHQAKIERDRADSLARVERAAQMQKEEQERLAQEAERYARLKKKYGKATADLIVNGEVRLGWSREMCREAWGEPNDINTSIGSWGTHEQWVYYSSYLYFENGKLTSIQL